MFEKNFFRALNINSEETVEFPLNLLGLLGLNFSGQSSTVGEIFWRVTMRKIGTKVINMWKQMDSFIFGGIYLTKTAG